MCELRHTGWLQETESASGDDCGAEPVLALYLLSIRIWKSATAWPFSLSWIEGSWNDQLIGEPLKNFLYFCNILVCINWITLFRDLEIYTHVLQTCLRALCWFRYRTNYSGTLCRTPSRRWILGIRTQRIHAFGATPLKKHCHLGTMNLTSNTIKSKDKHAQPCSLLNFQCATLAIYRIKRVVDIKNLWMRPLKMKNNVI